MVKKYRIAFLDTNALNEVKLSLVQDICQIFSIWHISHVCYGCCTHKVLFIYIYGTNKQRRHRVLTVTSANSWKYFEPSLLFKYLLLCDNQILGIGRERERERERNAINSLIADESLKSVPLCVAFLACFVSFYLIINLPIIPF